MMRNEKTSERTREWGKAKDMHFYAARQHGIVSEVLKMEQR